MNANEIFIDVPRPARFPLPRLLRGLGAAVTVGSLSLLLFQNWSGGNDLHRYLMLLAQTLVLAAAGIACGRWLREPKGARIFLMLALAAVPVNFAILGAFIYSVPGTWPAGLGEMLTWHALATEGLTVDGGNWGVTLSGAVTWRAQNLASVLVAAGLGLPLLTLVSLLGFLVLARGSARPLTALFLAGNGALLLPIRDGEAVGLLLAAAVAGGLHGLHRLMMRDPALRTHEGRIARALLFLAPLILAGRTLWLYSAGPVLFTAASVTAFLLLRSVGPELPAAWRRAAETGSLLPALLTGLGAAALLTDASVDMALAVAIAAFVIGGMVLELSTRALEGRNGYRLLAAAAVSGLLLLDLAAHGGAIIACLTLAAGIATAGGGLAAGERRLLGLGIAATAAGFGYLVAELVRYFDFGGWSGLALLGVATVVAGSLIERHGDALRAWLSSRLNADATRR